MSGLRVGIVGGTALVARAGDAVMVVDDDDAGHDGLRRTLLDLVHQMCGSAAPARGALTRRLIAEIVALPPESVPAFAVAAVGPTGTEVLLVGAMRARWTDGDGEHELSGRDASNWVDRFVDATTQRIAVGREDVTDPPHPLTDLGTGIVPGAAALLDFAATAEPSAASDPEAVRAPVSSVEPVVPVSPAVPVVPAPPVVPASPVAPAGDDTGETQAVPVTPAGSGEEPEPRFVSVAFGDAADDEEERSPLPVAGSGAVQDHQVAPDVVDSEVLVHGVRCVRGHFNNPETRYCVLCGRGFDQGASKIISQGPRPPLGVLVIDDGAAFVLDTDYVMGREPEIDAAVASGHARALSLDDPNRSVSRLHADLKLDGWNVLVVDRGSVNGTYLLLPGADQWTRLGQGQPVVVPPGGRVALGQRTFVYESHHLAGR